ncbi:MAG TPA: FGGY-family carbohydrate kinase [Bacillota bacterium]|nr:FGGY-family carbohydrate kinase [Bacillota bacterium]
MEKLNLEKTALGIEFGSTRIKAVLIDENYQIVGSGEYKWDNQYEKGIWTYDLNEVWIGMQDAYRELANAVKQKYNLELTEVGAIGFSGMMHGYLPFDSSGKQLVPFRTWRNTTTEVSAKELTELFSFNIPHRWSIAHLYQAILDNEEHVKYIDFLTTLAGFVHWKVSDEKVLGVGEASGMFPIDPKTEDYDGEMLRLFDEKLSKYKYSWRVRDILPPIQKAGEIAGRLTKKGAKMLDPTGTLRSGIPLCPPEGDAGTGMVATNSIDAKTGNISAGTSVFAMIVLEENLSNYYHEIDVVTTPSAKPVAMVHCNNFTSDINDWVSMFKEIIELTGMDINSSEIFTLLLKEALEANSDTGGIVNCNYYSGEPITGFEEGRPLLVRMPDSKLTLANFMRAQIYSAIATLKIGMDILTENENIDVDYILGHGGFFKTKNVGQQLMADALNIPISVMTTASEGGPWGMAILAMYALDNNGHRTLADYLNKEVFTTIKKKTLYPEKEGNKSFINYMEQYKKLLKVEQAAIEHLSIN